MIQEKPMPGQGSVLSNLRYARALLRMTFKSVASQRNSVIIRACFAFTNHALYLPVWIALFGIVPTINGWGLPQTFMAYGIAMCSWGVVSLFAFGLRTIPEQIDHGEFDAYLTLPKPVLLSAAISSSRNTGIGDLVFGLGLLVFCFFKFSISPLYVVFFILTGSLIFASGVLFFATLGFWIRQFYSSAEEIYFSYNMIGTRPAPIFSGIFKLFTLTVIPAGLMTHLPVDFLSTHALSSLFFLIVGVLAHCVFSVFLFRLGLRYYESGNRFGVRG